MGSRMFYSGQISALMCNEAPFSVNDIATLQVLFPDHRTLGADLGSDRPLIFLVSQILAGLELVFIKW